MSIDNVPHYDNVPHFDLVSDVSSTKEFSIVKDFFSFRLFIAQSIIRVTFFTGFIIQILIGVYIIFNVGNSFPLFLIGLGFIFFGWIPLRLLCELMIISFKIHDELVTLNKTMSKQTP